MTAPDHDAWLRGLIRYAAGLGFCEKTVREVYELVVADTKIGETDRAVEVRRRLLLASALT